MGEEGQKTKLFREKSLEAIDSPESLNDYLRVTSPQVWLVLAAVIVLLIGGILWGIFGRIRTTEEFAVYVGEDRQVCYVNYNLVEQVLARGVVNVNGRDYPLQKSENLEVTVLPEDSSSSLLLAGNLKAGDLVVEVPVTIDLANGYYTGKVVTEDLQPISLLLQ